MLTLQSVAPGTRFKKWDGTICRLLEKSAGWAKIKIESAPKKEVVILNDDGSVKKQFMGSGKNVYDVSLGCEVIEVLPEEENMNKETLDALRSAREGAAKPSEEAEDKAMKTAEKKKLKKGSVARKPHGKPKGETGQRGSIFLFDHPVTAVIRWMGKDEFSFAETMGALKMLRVSPMPAEATVRTQLNAGKAGQRGDPAKLSADQQKSLRDAAKKVEAKLEAEAEKD